MFKNMKIGTRLGFGFGLIVLLICVLSVIMIVQIQSVSTKLDTVVNDRFPKTRIANNIINEVNIIARAMRNMALLTDSTKIKEENERIEVSASHLTSYFDTLEETILSKEGKEKLAAATSARQAYVPLQTDLRKMFLEKKRDAAIPILMGQFRDLQNDYMKKVNDLIDFQTELTEADGIEGIKTAENAELMIYLIAGFILLFSILAAVFITGSITKPITQCITIANKVAAGDTSIEVKTDSKDETGMLLSSLEKMINSIKSLVTDAGMLSKAAVEGKLDTRADASKHQGDYRKIVEGVNATLDAVIGPLNVAAEYVDRISKGDIPQKITDTYLGDFNEIKNNLNRCIEAVNLLVTDAGMLSKAAVEGKLDTRADASKHEGDYRKIVEGVNETLDAVIGPLNVAAEYVDRISKGDIPQKITDTYHGDFNEIKNNLNQCIDALSTLIAQMKNMADEHNKGDIDVVIAVDKFEGVYKVMAQGTNDMVNGHIAVKKKAMACIAEFGKGNFNAPLEQFPGKKAFINNTIEQVRINLKNLIADAELLSKAAVEGKLATRADASKHEGDFRKIVQGVNETLDAVIGPLNVAAKYVDDISKGIIPKTINDNYNGDFNVIKNNLNVMVKMMTDLLAETDIIIKAAADGELDKRADATKFVGGWHQLVKGVNDTITNIVNPLMVTADYVDKVSKGVIPPEITDTYKGQYNVIKNNLNNVVKMMSNLLKETDVIIKAAADGELDKRANATLFVGGWNQLVSGVNDTITNIVNPLMVTADYVDKVSKGVIPPEITDTYKGQYNVIKNNLNNVVKMMSNLLKETDVIIKAAADGELDKRANAALFVGGWNQLVSGVNDTITNIVKPLMVTADYVEKVSKGVIPPEITDTYKGQYNLIKNNLNNMVKMMENLLKETDALVNAALTGSLSTRANAAQFIGGWNQLVAGVNKTLDAVLEPITEAATVLDKVAARDLTARVNGDYKGDHAKIKNSLNLAVENLDKALQQVSEATEQVTSASNQISSGSQSLAQGANEQASSLEEVSSSLEEMASMTKQNADNATQAKSLSGEADQNAKVGTEAMQRMSSAINRIKESSDQTAKIVKTIDEIAMQTNLLALNAAVEAARAGEAGRGFAVVAEEVRNLAQRSAQAAKNTADMISESVKNADDGVKIAGEVSQSFESIATSAKKVNDLIAEIAAASQEQSQGIDQVNSAVAQMDKVTQQNAANSEESASAAEELSSQAEELKTMIDQFALSLAAAQHKQISIRHDVRKEPVTVAPMHNIDTKAKKTVKKQMKTDEFLSLDDSSLKDF